MSQLLLEINRTKKPYAIRDIAELKYGFALPERDRQPGQVPVYGSSGIVGFHSTQKVDKPAIIVGRKGNVGSLFFSDVPSYPIDTAYFIDHPKEGFDLKFVYYLLQRINLPRYGGDSAVPGLGRESVYSLEVATPDLPSQKKIAEILGAYDAKIEVNNAMIKNLETMTQTIFNEWFVKLRFPGYEKVKMFESQMGKIPEGWSIKPLDEVADYLNGVASQKYPAENKEDSLPVIKIREMNSGIDTISGRASKNIEPKYIVNDGDILFSWSGSLVLMLWVGGKGILNQHIFKVTSKQYPNWFIYLWTYRHLQNFKKIAEGKATTMGHIQRHHLSESLILVPDDDMLNTADNILGKVFEQLISLKIQNNTLRQQRDQLLIKLI